MTDRISRRTVLQMLAAAPALRAVERETRRQTPTLITGQSPAQTARLQVGIVSRHLQWTNLEDAIAVAKQAGFDAIEWNVRKGGHIPPDRVEDELPKAVELTRKAGLAVTMITTSIQDAKTPYTEAILRTAHGLGIRYYRGGEYYRYDYKGDLVAELEALKPRVATLAELNQKYGMTWAYHTHSAPGMIGGNVWDIWSVVKDFDPALIGLNYDTGHTTARGGVGWIDAAHVAHRHIACLAIKDVQWERRPDGKWRSEFCAVGEGMVDFPTVFSYLKSLGFAGPVNIHYEHHGLLGTDLGTWKLDMPRERFLEIVRQDLDHFRTYSA
jgi:L-ribulose-5-phosphate 3-epimerase